MMDYDRRHGYRGPESYIDLATLPAGDDRDEALDDALAKIRDSGKLQPAIVLAASPTQITAYLRGGRTPRTRAALALGAATGQKGFGTVGQALGAQAGYRMAGRGRGVVHWPPACSSANSGTSALRLSHTPPPSSMAPSCSPRR